jgi:hypothetical protein
MYGPSKVPESDEGAECECDDDRNEGNVPPVLSEKLVPVSEPGRVSADSGDHRQGKRTGRENERIRSFVIPFIEQTLSFTLR